LSNQLTPRPTYHIYRGGLPGLSIDEAVAALNPLRYYEMQEEGPGNQAMLDASTIAPRDGGYSFAAGLRVGVFSGSPIPGVPGEYMRNFDGIAGWAQMGDPPLPAGDGPCSIWCWTRVRGYPAVLGALVSTSHETGVRTNFKLMVNHAGNFVLSPSGDDCISPVAYYLDQLHLVAGTYDPPSHTLKLYVDGLPVATRVIAGPLARTGDFGSIGVAQINAGRSQYLSADIGRVGTIPRTLTDAEVLSLWTAGAFAPTRATPSFVGALHGVINEPAFVADINGGFTALKLELDHYPSELAWLDLVRVDLPDGTVIGYWKHEDQDADWAADKRAFILNLVPLVAEASEAGFDANFTFDATQKGPPLGSADMADITTRAVNRTAHCSPGVILPIGATGDHAYNQGQPVDAFNQHVLYAGVGWWWFCYGDGRIDIRNTPPLSVRLTVRREAIDYHGHEDTHNLHNDQPASGGTPAGASKPLTTRARNLDPNDPFSIQRAGRRVAPNFADSSILSQALLDIIAANVLALHGRVNRKITIKLQNYNGAWLFPGTQVYLRTPGLDPNADYTVQGPFVVQKSTRTGATGEWVLELTDVPSPVKSAGGLKVVAAAAAVHAVTQQPAPLTKWH
jgi:hypothetical protein